MSKNNSNAMLFKGNFLSCTNLKNFDSFSFFPTSESLSKIEVDPKEEASVVEVFQDVLDKLSDVGKKEKLLKFFKSWHLLKVDRVFISFMLRSVNLSILKKTINKTSKSPHAFAMCSIRTDLLNRPTENMTKIVTLLHF
jgi:hypothetical protein